MSGTTLNSSSEVNLFLSETISLTHDLLNQIMGQIHHIDLRREKEYFWNKQLADLTSDVSKFVEVTTLLSKLLQKGSQSHQTEIKNSHIHLLSIMKGINHARQKEDTVMMEDLIKYELKDNLTQWKIDFIPQTKRLLNA
jgi:hypothetical protein